MLRTCGFSLDVGGTWGHRGTRRLELWMNPLEKPAPAGDEAPGSHSEASPRGCALSEELFSGVDKLKT